MKNNLFILGYNAVDYFCEWFNYEDNPNTKLHFVDNGNQEIPDKIKRDLVYKTTKNLGASGGWNLCCNIAFNILGYDKIIIGEEDARFGEEILNEITTRTTPNVLCGTYNNSFEFSLYGIHKDTWNTVGGFDENFLLAGCEDNDYKHRCKLNNVEVISLGVPHHFNGNSTTSPGNSAIPQTIRDYNGKYVEQKWGNYKYSIPFNDDTYKHMPTDLFKELYGNITKWPSETEFGLFKNKN